MKKLYKTKVLNFRIDENLHDRLKSVAIASRKTISELITIIIEDHIEDYSENALLDQLMQISPAQRKKLMAKIEKEEEKSKKGG